MFPYLLLFPSASQVKIIHMNIPRLSLRPRERSSPVPHALPLLDKVCRGGGFASSAILKQTSVRTNMTVHQQSSPHRGELTYRGVRFVTCCAVSGHAPRLHGRNLQLMSRILERPSGTHRRAKPCLRMHPKGKP